MLVCQGTDGESRAAVCYTCNARSDVACADILSTCCKTMTLEKALASIEDDELVAVMPKSIRLRKKRPDKDAHNKAERATDVEAE